MKTKLLQWLFAAALALFAVAGASAQSTARSTPIGVGDMAPDFTLEDQNGVKRTLSGERGKRPVVLIFYRGHW
jgi:hypothetical protein